jgi:menaquinone-specific isochorismate synthase
VTSALLGERLASRTRPVPDPGELLDALGPDGFAWLQEGAGMVTSGVAARVVVETGPGRIARAAAEVAALLGGIETDDPLRLPGTGPLAVGALPFSDAVPGTLVVPAVVVARDSSGLAWVTETSAAGGLGDGPALGAIPSTGTGWKALDVKEHPDRASWTAAVVRALAAIRAGRLRKVVLARELTVEADSPLDRRRVLDFLLRTHPSCFAYAMGGFVGASPELLVRRVGDEVSSQPMAGSVPRGASPAEDDRLAEGLAGSTKDAEEHRLLVEAVLDALAPACIQPPAAGPAEVVRLATVSHLATRVAGRLRPPAPSALALAGLLHPTPAVGGIPRPAALAAIAELEGFDRGLYAGPVGWVDARGAGEWAVALRGAELDGCRARLWAGAGIVAGSDPAAEWAETEAKLEPVLSALRH